MKLLETIRKDVTIAAAGAYQKRLRRHLAPHECLERVFEGNPALILTNSRLILLTGAADYSTGDEFLSVPHRAVTRFSVTQDPPQLMVWTAGSETPVMTGLDPAWDATLLQAALAEAVLNRPVEGVARQIRSEGKAGRQAGVLGTLGLAALGVALAYREQKKLRRVLTQASPRVLMTQAKERAEDAARRFKCR